MVMIDFVHGRLDAELDAGLDGREYELAQQPTPARHEKERESQGPEGLHGLSSGKDPCVARRGHERARTARKSVRTARLATAVP
jgi:hypothetical protein